MKSRLQKWGNSLALRIPKSFAEEAQVEEGAAVDLQLKNGQLVIVPLREVPSLKELLAGVNAENLHGEINTGDPQGGEAW